MSADVLDWARDLTMIQRLLAGHVDEEPMGAVLNFPAPAAGDRVIAAFPRRAAS